MKNQKFKTILTLIISFGFFGLVGSSEAADHYVSPTGSDTWENSINTNTPCDFETAISNAQAGDVVYLLDGTYIDEDPSEHHPYSAFNPSYSGTAGSPIIFKSLNPHEAIIRAKNFPGEFTAMGLDNRDYITLEDFTIIGGLKLYYCDNIIVRNIELTGGFYSPSDPSLNWGIGLSIVNNSLVENCKVSNMVDSGNSSHNTACIMLFGPSDNNIIQRNEVDGNNKIIYSGYGTKAGDMDYNIWRYNFANNVISGFLGMGSTDELTDTTNNTYYDNLVINSTNAFDLNHGVIDYIIHDNTAYNVDNFSSAGKNSNIDNVLWNNVSAGQNRFISWSGYPDALPFSSLLYSSNYNCIYDFSEIAFREKSPTLHYYDFAEWQGSGVLGDGNYPDLNSVNEDPSFVDLSGTMSEIQDFELGGSSPCSGVGKYSDDMGADVSTVGIQSTSDTTSPSHPTGLSVE